MSSIPFTRGQNCILRLVQDNEPVIIAAKSWSVEENANEANDGVNGELRDRLDKIINFYSGTVEIYQSDRDVMDKIIAAQSADDAQGLPLDQYAVIQKRHRDGTKVAYLMEEAVFGPFTDNASGRAENVMLTLKFRFRFWKPVQAI